MGTLLENETHVDHDDLCIICHTKTRTPVRQATEAGLSRLREALVERSVKNDKKHEAAIERLQYHFHFGVLKSVFYHHTPCYANFTSKTMIKRLDKIRDKKADLKRNEAEHQALRSHGNTDLDLCILCQRDYQKDQLRTVQTFKVNKRLADIAEKDFDLKRRLRKECDAIACELKYHTFCLTDRERQAKRATCNALQGEKQNLSFLKVVQELRLAAEKRQVLQLSAVFERYQKLAEDIQETVPVSYLSRLATFRLKLEAKVGDLFEFHRPLNRCIEERLTLLIPHNYIHNLTSGAAYEANYEQDTETFGPADEFKELVHVALKLRRDINTSPGHIGLNVSAEEAESVVPESLFTFLSVLIGGDAIIQDDDSETVSEMTRIKIISIAQDLIFACSKGRKMTPKHIGLASVLHQMTRSKQLVETFSRAGHCISYDQLRKIDTTLGEVTLQALDKTTGAVVPPNFSKTMNPEPSTGALLHITVDNIDLLTDTLDGKNTFHATQMVAFQRGSSSTDDILKSVQRRQNKSLPVPQAIGNLTPAKIFPDKTLPVFSESVSTDWYCTSENNDVDKDFNLEFAFILQSQSESRGVSGWTEFHKKATNKTHEISAVGYMPLILNPAHEFDTLNTAILRSLAVADRLKQKYVILTADQDLYYRLVELRWSNPVYQERVILRMGGLHISLNFLTAIGQHMNGSGLYEVWVESGLFGEGTAQKVLNGRSYDKGMRGHKLTAQSLWSVILPKFRLYLSSDAKGSELLKEIDSNSNDLASLLVTLEQSDLNKKMQCFALEEGNKDVNFKFWWTYLEMVSVLLLFTRSIRDGSWDLYCNCLPKMLDYMAWYDHQNYLKSMSVYVADMHQLPSCVKEAFIAGDFVLKRSEGTFNMVDPDHAQEWLVGEVKDAGGVVGITNDPNALQRWALTYHWRTEITRKTLDMLRVRQSSNLHAELYSGRRSKDAEAVKSLSNMFRSLNIFSWTPCDTLKNVATKDVASAEIQASLLKSKEGGNEIVLSFVSQRLLPGGTVSYHAPMKKNIPLTFNDLYKNKPSTQIAKKAVAKADRSVMQRVIGAYEAGRTVDLAAILKHELVPSPPALANAEGVLRSGNKALLLNALLKKTNIVPASTLTLQRLDSHLIVDGPALIMAMGKPKNAKTFGDYADRFNEKINQIGAQYKRIDIIFDRYLSVSIKAGTRAKRTQKNQPIRKIIQSRDVPLPKRWDNFMALPANKADLARFLSEELVRFSRSDHEIVVAGGFEDSGIHVSSTNPETDVSSLKANHEEADTRLVLHAVNSPFESVVVLVRDTDVFFLLLHHRGRIPAKHLWMMAGTSANRKYIPIHEVANNVCEQEKSNLPALHALTGSDVTSYISGISKPEALKVFALHGQLLSLLGISPLTEETLADVEKFMVKLYKIKSPINTTDEARHVLFSKVTTPEALPPTSDAARLHIRRAHYQTFIWRNAHVKEIERLSPTDYGWRQDSNNLIPVLISLEAVPKACKDLFTCGCKAGCKTAACICRREVKQPCTPGCYCKGICTNGRLQKDQE